MAKIKAAQTMKMVAHLSSQGMDLPMTLYAKRPNLTRKELTIGQQKILFVFDGTTAWQINPLQASSEPIVVAGPELEVIRLESDFDNPLVDYQARGYVITNAGTETIAGRSLHHLKLTKNGITQECYLDAETGLEAKTVNQSPMGALEQEFSDYRDVQGLKLPFLVRTLQNGVRVAEIKSTASTSTRRLTRACSKSRGSDRRPFLGAGAVRIRTDLSLCRAHRRRVWTTFFLLRRSEAVSYSIQCT